jgi:integrase
MYARRTLPGPSTIDPKVDRAQYEADCLAGRRFPVVTDTVMQERCRSAWRLREWFEIFRRYHLSTVKDSRNRASRLRRNFAELLDLDPNTITRRTLTPWFQLLGTTSHAKANESLAELKFIYNKLIEYGWFEGANPIVGMKKFPGSKARKRFVQYEELPLLLASIDQEPLQFQLIILLTLVCGCRPGEALAMRWTDLKLWQESDAQGGLVWRGRWSKPTTKTGVGHLMPLPIELIARFQQLDRLSEEWVFPGDLTHCRRIRPGPVSYDLLNQSWRRVCRRINIQDLWLYDMRRSCATIMMNRGVDLGTISKGILAHSNFQHTAVYCQTMPQTVELAIQDHSKFVLGGGRPEVKTAPVPPTAGRSTAYHSPEAMEWPG